MTIIALAGKKQVGKDTMADVLVKKHGFTRVALADPLRNICARVFYMDPKLFEDGELKDKRMQRICVDLHDVDAIRTIVEFEWGYTIPYESRELMEEFHGTEMDSPRDVLRTVGMMLREAVSADIWIDLAIHKISDIGAKVVITDCRFENERQAFSNMGATMVLIKRNDNGESREHEFDLGREEEYDVVFTNDGALTTYQSEIDMWYTIRREELQFYKAYKYEF